MQAVVSASPLCPKLIASFIWKNRGDGHPHPPPERRRRCTLRDPLCRLIITKTESRALITIFKLCCGRTEINGRRVFCCTWMGHLSGVKLNLVRYSDEYDSGEVFASTRKAVQQERTSRLRLTYLNLIRLVFETVSSCVEPFLRKYKKHGCFVWNLRKYRRLNFPYFLKNNPPTSVGICSAQSVNSHVNTLSSESTSYNKHELAKTQTRDRILNRRIPTSDIATSRFRFALTENLFPGMKHSSFKRIEQVKRESPTQSGKIRFVRLIRPLWLNYNVLFWCGTLAVCPFVSCLVCFIKTDVELHLPKSSGHMCSFLIKWMWCLCEVSDITVCFDYTGSK